MAVNIHEAKTHFSQLVERAERGEEIIIARSGRPVARLVPLGQEQRLRRFGTLRGQFVVPDDFDEFIPPDFLPYLTGEGITDGECLPEGT